MQTLSLDAFTRQLQQLQPRHGGQKVLDFLSSTRPAFEQLAPYVAFDPGRYVRRRLYRDEDFELLLLCWEPGQATPIHDHEGQRGWLSVQYGALAVEEFQTQDQEGRLVEGRVLRLRAVGLKGIEAGQALVEAVSADTIHRVWAPRGRTLSLHVYARPLDSFLVFDPRVSAFKRVTV